MSRAFTSRSYTWEASAMTDLDSVTPWRKKLVTRKEVGANGDQLYHSVAGYLTRDHVGHTKLERLDSPPAVWPEESCPFADFDLTERKRTIARNQKRKDAQLAVRRERVRLAWSAGLDAPRTSRALHMGASQVLEALSILELAGELVRKDGDVEAWWAIQEA